jgi:hypothetical protein
MTASPRFRVRGPLTAVAAGAVAVAVAGCGSSSGGSLSSGGGGTASTPIPSTSAASPTGGVGQVPTSPPVGGVSHGRVIHLKGVVERGAEPSCLVLRTAHGAYDLMGPVAQRLPPERTIVVVGRVVTGVASHCMDGTPFEVKAIATR